MVSEYMSKYYAGPDLGAQPGRLHICLVTFYLLVSRIVRASTAQLQKAAQGPTHV